MSRKIFQKYTKSFGGKIWPNLHSVSPYNVFEQNLTEFPFSKFSAKNTCIHQLLQNVSTRNVKFPWAKNLNCVWRNFCFKQNLLKICVQYLQYNFCSSWCIRLIIKFKSNMTSDKLLQKFVLKFKTSNIQFSRIFWSKDVNFLLFNSLFMKIIELWPAMLPLSKPYSARTFVAQGKIAFPQNFCAQR